MQSRLFAVAIEILSNQHQICRCVLKFCQFDKISLRICVFAYKQLRPCLPFIFMPPYLIAVIFLLPYDTPFGKSNLSQKLFTLVKRRKAHWCNHSLYATNKTNADIRIEYVLKKDKLNKNTCINGQIKIYGTQNNIHRAKSKQTSFAHRSPLLLFKTAAPSQQTHDVKMTTY